MRKLVKIVLIGLCIAILPVSGFSQSNLSSREHKDFLYRDEMSGGFAVHSFAYSLFIEKARIKSIYKKQIFQADFTYYKHPKEKRQPGVDYQGKAYKSYVYGKKNNFFAFHFRYGYRHTIGEKANHSGVGVYFTYMLGASLGYLKPYYLELFKTDGSLSNLETSSEKYTAENAERFLDNSQNSPSGIPSIAGYTGFQKGFKDIEPVFGGNIKLGLHFDWGKYDAFIKALEVGVMADVYYKKIDMMIIENNHPYIINVYASLQLGKRW